MTLIGGGRKAKERVGICSGNFVTLLDNGELKCADGPGCMRWCLEQNRILNGCLPVVKAEDVEGVELLVRSCSVEGWVIVVGEVVCKACYFGGRYDLKIVDGNCDGEGCELGLGPRRVELDENGLVRKCNPL